MLNDVSAKADLFAVLDAIPDGFDAVRLAVVEGRIDGIQKRDIQSLGVCGCIKQHLAYHRKVDVRDLPSVAKLAYPNRSELECALYSVQPGNTPETNRILKCVLEWLNEWKSQQFEL